MNRKNSALMLLACGLLAACASLIGPREVTLPLSKLQASMDRRFPLNNRVLEVFDIALSRPQLALEPESGRIVLAMDAAMTPPFAQRAWQGSMALSGRLAVDPQRNAVLMAEPRIERFMIDGMAPLFQRQLGKVANILLEQIAGDTPIYHFKPGDLRYAGVEFVPTAIDVRRDTLLVSVEPKK